MKSNKPILVIVTPSLQRTGSELVLFNLLPYLKEDFSITVISVYKGELYNELPAYIQKDYLYNSVTSGFLSKVVKRLKDAFTIPAKLRKYAKGTWYINTIVLPDMVKFAEENNLPCIVHTHELEQMYKLLSVEQIKRLVEYPDLIVANSEISASTIKKFGRTKQVEICYPAFETNKIVQANYNKESQREKFGIKKEEFVWAMCGTIDENKNPLMFVDVVCEMKKSTISPFRFIWIGDAPTGTETFLEKVKNYASTKGVAEHVVWIGNVKEKFHECFCVANGFILTSQFESFSLVTLEALLLGLPVVANKCGGVNEILEDKYGYVLEQKNNVEEMTAKMLECMKNPMDEVEVAAQVKFAQRFDISIWGMKWREIILIHEADA